MPRRRKTLVLILRRRLAETVLIPPGISPRLASKLIWVAQKIQVRLINEAERRQRLESLLTAPGNMSLAQLRQARVAAMRRVAPPGTEIAPVRRSTWDPPYEFM
jgi:hypothetical protein